MADHLRLFRERLLLARRRKGWTQQQLGERAQVNFTTISRIENGEAKQVYIDTAKRLARALEMTTDELLGMDEGEQQSIDQQMMEALSWVNNDRTSASLQSIEAGTRLLLEQGFIEECEAPPHRPLKRFRLTSKGVAHLAEAGRTYFKIRDAH